MKLVRGRVRRAITISQPGYLEDLRDKFGINTITGPLTPMVDEPREPESVTTLDRIERVSNCMTGYRGEA